MLEDSFLHGKNAFAGAVRPVLGNGEDMAFWHNKWLCNDKLKVIFPSLFDITVDKEWSVGAHGYWKDGRWRWSISWERPDC